MTTFDFVLLGLIGFFAVWGAFTGFSKQVTRWVAVIVAFIAASAGGRFLAQLLTERFQVSITVGTVLATLLLFILVWLLVRLLFATALRRLVVGPSNRRQWLDKSLGFILGGCKAALIIWFAISAAVLLENDFSVGNRHLSLPMEDSTLLQFAMQVNALKCLQINEVDDLIGVTKMYVNPQIAQKLKDDVDFSALENDARFRKIVPLRRALQDGANFQWLQNSSVMELLQEPQTSRHVEKMKAPK